VLIVVMVVVGSGGRLTTVGSLVVVVVVGMRRGRGEGVLLPKVKRPGKMVVVVLVVVD